MRSSAKSIAAQYDERKSAKTVREIRLFVDKLPYLQKMRSSQANHTSMAELIREFTDTEKFYEMLYVSLQFYLAKMCNIYFSFSVKTNF